MLEKVLNKAVTVQSRRNIFLRQSSFPTTTNSNISTTYSSSNNREKLIFIVGATGVGKSKLAVALAHHFQTDVLNADSMQVTISYLYSVNPELPFSYLDLQRSRHCKCKNQRKGSERRQTSINFFS